MEELHSEAYADPIPENSPALLRHLPDIFAIGAMGVFMLAPPEILRWYYDNYQNYQLYISHLNSGEFYVLAALVSQLPVFSILTFTLIARLTKPKE